MGTTGPVGDSYKLYGLMHGGTLSFRVSQLKCKIVNWDIRVPFWAFYTLCHTWIVSQAFSKYQICLGVLYKCTKEHANPQEYSESIPGLQEPKCVNLLSDIFLRRPVAAREPPGAHTSLDVICDGVVLVLTCDGTGCCPGAPRRHTLHYTRRQ